MKQRLLAAAFGIGLIAFAAIQFVPSAPVAVPAELPPAQREAHRVLNFDGIANFRDLGGYRTGDNRQVRWGRLYRAGTLGHASDHDLEQLQRLELEMLVDFRSAAEKAEEPNRLPPEPRFRQLAIPVLDDGNQAMVGELRAAIEEGDMSGFEPDHFMLSANRQFATEFTPQFREFIQSVQAADGKPVLWHCTAGKDRTGFASAILLRILGVPEAQVMADYLASGDRALDARRTDLLLLRLFKGEEAADKLGELLGVKATWLQAAFQEIDREWGSFERYVREGLQLDADDVSRLRTQLLEPV